MATYPAPVLAADRPLGITAPGDPFVLPATITGGSPTGSVVAEWHRQVSAGEKFGLTALGLTGASFPMYSGGQFYTTATQGDAGFVEVQFPNYGQTWDFALAWVAAQDGISLPIALNRTTVKWCQTSWTPGLTINFYGENLAHGNVAGGAAYVAVQPVGGGQVVVYPTTAANCHRVPFTVPDMPPGSYNVWAHNGHGGDFGWSKRLAVQVIANANHIKTRNFGAATRITLSKTDAAANDTKLATLWVDNTNLEIDPALGPYPVSKPVVIPNFTRLASSNPTQDVQFFVPAGTVWPNPDDRGMFGTNSATMVLLENIEVLNPSNVNLNNNAAQGREVGLFGCANVTQFWLKSCKARWTAPYSEFQAGVVKAAEPVSCFRFKTSQHVFLDDCEFTGSGNPFIECSQVFLTNYHMVGTNNADHQLYGLHTKEWSVIGGTVRDLDPDSKDGVDRLIRVIKCGGQNGVNQRHYFEGITGTDLGVVWEGVNQSPDANQFELNLYEGNTATYISNATASTPTTVTLAGNLTNKAVPGYHLVTIVAGKGRGQTRGIASSTGFSITVDEPWNVLPDSTSVVETGVFARDVIFYNVDYTGKEANATDARFTHNSFFNGFGGVHGFILNQCRGASMRQGWSIISTQHDETLIDQSSFNVVKNSAFPDCRWGARIESNPPVQTWKGSATGVLGTLSQNNTYDNTLLSELIFQLPRDVANIGATPVDGLILNKQKFAKTVLNDYTPTFVDDPAYPPVAPLPQALKNFSQSLAQAPVSQVTIPAGQYPFSYLGNIVLTLSQQSWYTTQNVNKISTPSANRMGYISGNPANLNFGVKTLAPASNASDPLPGYVLDLKQAITVDGALFGGLPTAIGQLVAPVLNAASTITDSSFTITWATVTGADSYRVRLNGSTLFMPGNVTSYTFTGLPAATQATAEVQALDSTNAKQPSSYSNLVMVTTAAVKTNLLLSQQGVLSDADLGMGSTTFGTDQTTKIQAAYDLAESQGKNLYVDVKASLNYLKVGSGVLITGPSNQTCGLIQRPGIHEPLLQNKNPKGGAGALDLGTDHDVVVENLIINGAGYDTAGTALRNLTSGNGGKAWNGLYYYRGVKGYGFRNCIMRNPRAIAGNVGNFQDWTLDGNRWEYSPTIQNYPVTSGETGTLRHDGPKHHGPFVNAVVKNNTFIHTVDDNRSYSANDVWRNDPAHTDGEVLCYDKFACYGPITTVRDTNNVSQACFHGVRVLSIGELVDDLVVDNASGDNVDFALTVDNLDFNYTGNNQSKNCYYDSAAIAAGTKTGRAKIGTLSWKNSNTTSTQNRGSYGYPYVPGYASGYAGAIMFFNNVDVTGAIKIDDSTISGGNNTDYPTILVSGTGTWNELHINNLFTAGYTPPNQLACVQIGSSVTVASKTGNFFAHTPTAPVLTTSASDLALNADSYSYQDSSKVYSEFARQDIQVTGGTTAIVKAITTQKSGETGGIPNTSSLQVLWNEALLQTLTCTQNGVEQSFNLTLPGAAGLLTVLQGCNARPGDDGQVQGTRSTSVTFPVGTTATVRPWAKKSNRLALVVDSIPSGIGATQPGLDAFPLKLRALHPDWDIVYAGSYGGKRAIASFNNTTSLNAVMSQLHTVLDGAGTQSAYCNLGVNDYYSNLDLSTYTLAVTAFVDRFHSEFPNATLFYQTLSSTPNESAAFNGTTAPQWRNAVTDLTTSRAWLQIVDGATLWTSAQTVDGLHPTTAGHAAAVPKVDAIVFAGAAVDLTTGLIHHYTLNQTLADSSPNNLMLTAVNGPAFVSGGKGVQFVSASQHYLRRAHSTADDFSNGFTNILRFRLAAVDSGNPGRILLGYSSFTNRAYGAFLFYFLRDDQQSSQTYGSLNLEVVDANGISYRVSTTNQEFGTGPHTLVGRYDKSNLWMNLDSGSNIALAGGLTSIDNGSHEFRIGTDERNGLYPDTTIDTVWLFNRALNNTSVTAALTSA